MKRKTIMGCDARGDGDSPYLTRWTLVETRLGSAYLHWFHRSDADDLHDHPWGFVSLILWRGYVEQTPTGCRRKWPGMVLFRRATHRHRVELVGGRPALSFVLRGPCCRQWGFWTRAGWVQWQQYFREKGCR